ncbi:MAG: flippase-like domain-containing protein [Chitinophagaceae bacterium]|nr:flippase-like domain-containing protein [Chitinophagaceae bacterium]MBL0057084.1 flippase-like domain-containing protein [Chitinophagaceae bacterium]
MRKRLYSILNYVIFLGGGIFLVWWQLRGMSPEDEKEFYNAFRYANYWLIIPVIAMSLLSHLSRSMRWKLLMESMEYQPKLKNVFAVTMIGYLANSAVPRLGEILKCTLLARYEKLKVDKLVGSILIERAFDFLCYIVFIGLTILIQLNVLGGYIGNKVSGIGQGPGMPLWLKLTIIGASVILFFLALKLLFRKYPDNKVISKIRHFVSGIGIGIRSIGKLKKRKAFIAHTLFIWLMYLLQIYIGFHAMGGTAHLGIKAACSVLTLATLAMIITPGGIGSFPLFVMEILTLYGIASPLGKAFGWLIWGVSTGIIIVIGLLSLIIMPYINRKKHEIDPTHT